MENIERVTTLERLAELAKEKRAVTMSGHYTKRHQPAAFIIHMSGAEILKLFSAGMYVYSKQEK